MTDPDHPRRSILLLVDGYNVIAPVAPPRNPGRHWLQDQRMQLVDRLRANLDAETRGRTCVVFDAADPPSDRPHRFEIDGIDVIFAVDHPEADDLIEELIAAHTSPKSMAVVSSDQRVQTAARRRGCRAFESQTWMDELLEGRVALAVEITDSHTGDDEPSEKPADLGKSDVNDWMREFGFDE